MKVGFLGLGKMGTPIARRLHAAGHEVTVWNRSRDRAEALLAEGVKVASTPAEAAQGNEIVLTMLFDDAAHQEVLYGAEGLLGALKPGMTHISLSTISVAFSERLTADHARIGVDFIAAPVFGRPNVAEEGRLWIVVGGADAAVRHSRALLSAFSRGISVVGKEPRQAHAVKLGGNFLISAMIHSLGEGFVYASGQGVEPEVFFETVNSALFQSPYYAAYAKVMLHPPEQPAATIEMGAKDLRLLREAAESRHTRLSLADQLWEVFTEAQQVGLGSEDWAVGQYKMAQRRGRESRK
jgi:3-hydroxyisobutyrate dehydrogenase-like beta-hydroxyacid dehydrogenase